MSQTRSMYTINYGQAQAALCTAAAITIRAKDFLRQLTAIYMCRTSEDIFERRVRKKY